MGIRGFLEKWSVLPEGGFDMEFGAILEGRHTLLLSGVTALCGYSPQAITLRSRRGRVRITGSGMTMVGFGGGRLTVSGRVDGITMEGGE